MSFQSTLPVRGGTPSIRRPYTSPINFNPPSPCGEGRSNLGKTCWTLRFQSTLPMRGGTGTSFLKIGNIAQFQSTLPMRGGTTVRKILTAPLEISIHPPHAGRDAIRPASRRMEPYFNPPSPCGEGLRLFHCSASSAVFQSTLPMRGGTGRKGAEKGAGQYFNPPSPCGEGPTGSGRSCWTRPISIHPPHAGRDSIVPWKRPRKEISIHPPHAGRDLFAGGNRVLNVDFNPPSPCGEGLSGAGADRRGQAFQSTLPMRGGTLSLPVAPAVIAISIHPPHAGRDAII